MQHIGFIPFVNEIGIIPREVMESYNIFATNQNTI